MFRSQKRSHDVFLHNQGNLPPIDNELEKFKKSIKARDFYGPILDRVRSNAMAKKSATNESGDVPNSSEDDTLTVNENNAMVPFNTGTTNSLLSTSTTSNALTLPQKKNPIMAKPKWHAPWKLYRVISGHLGWVRCAAIEPGNEWFATGSADRIIKIWDLASGKLKVSLTGHISSVRGLAFSHRHPYLFSCGEDKQVKCWDLEYNKVIRHYHGHLSAIYSIALHPTIDVLLTAGRDATARVWDMRTKANVHTLVGHSNTVASVICQSSEPQVCFTFIFFIYDYLMIIYIFIFRLLLVVMIAQ